MENTGACQGCIGESWMKEKSWYRLKDSKTCIIGLRPHLSHHRLNFIKFIKFQPLPTTQGQNFWICLATSAGRTAALEERPAMRKDERTCVDVSHQKFKCLSYLFILGRFARILFRLYIVHNRRCSRPHLQIQRRTSLACLVHLLWPAICEDSRHHPQAIVGASEAFGVALPSFERSDGYRTAEVA